MKKFISALVLFMILVSGSLAMDRKLSSEEIDQEATQINEATDISSEAPQKQDTNIEDEIERFLKENHMKVGTQKGGKYIAYKVETIGVPIGDSNFISHVRIAYNKAYLNAQTEMLMNVYGKIISETESKYFEDGSTGIDQQLIAEIKNEKEAQSKLGRILNKISSLAEAKVDEALQKMGINPHQIANMDITKKRETLQDNFSKVVQKGFSAKEALGIFVMKSFIGVDKNKMPAVGIVVVRSYVTADIARDIAAQRSPSITKAQGKRAESLLPEEDVNFLQEFGVRLFFDEEGRPALLSYAQTSPSYKGDNQIMKSKSIASALKSAQTHAQAQLAEFIGTMVSAHETEESGELTTAGYSATQKSGANEIEVSEVSPVTNFIKKISREAKSKASARMAGMNEIRNWQITDEYGRIVVGSVVVWDYDILETAKSIQTGKDTKYQAPKRETPKSNPMKLKGSKDVVDINDF